MPTQGAGIMSVSCPLSRMAPGVWGSYYGEEDQHAALAASLDQGGHAGESLYREGDLQLRLAPGSLSEVPPLTSAPSHSPS
jgi:hypothetical protein